MPRLCALLLLCALLVAGQRRAATALAISYPPGWNLISGPEGSHLTGAAGALYTLQAPNVDYQALPVDTPLTACVGYWAYFPDGGGLLPGSDAGVCTINVFTTQWSMIGNPSVTATADIQGAQAAYVFVNGDYQATRRIPPGLGAWAMGVGPARVNVPDYHPPAAPSEPAAATSGGTYPWHRGITATVFWIGEPATPDNTFINNIESAWDDLWQQHYGGFDDPDPRHRSGYLPAAFTPKENPFYFDLPYNDFTDNGKRKAAAFNVVPWANARSWGTKESMLKNRWIRLVKDGKACYAQWEDAGPFQYDDAAYVFGTNDPRPKNKLANSAGMDVSPATRDCLTFNGVDNAENQIDWQFVEESEVPDGPWKQIVTTSQIFWQGAGG